VVGYGTQKKSNLTGAVSVVNVAEAKRKTITMILENVFKVKPCNCAII
jgi:hypothetical protein